MNSHSGGGADGLLGLEAAVLRGDLRRREAGVTRRFGPTAFDHELLGAVEAAAGARVPLAVVLPLPVTAVPVLLGAAALVAAVVRTGSLAVKVAVASRHLTARTLYDELFFRDQRLADFIPRCTVDASGEARVIGRPSRDTGGRVYLSHDLHRLRGAVPELDGIVVDASATTPAAVEQTLLRGHHTGPRVYLTSDPLDPALSAVRSVGGVVWAWDAASLRVAAAMSHDCGHMPLAAPTGLLAAAADSVIVVDRSDTGGNEADDAMAELWSAIGGLAGSYRGTSPGHEHDALRWIWSIHNTLAMLPVPPARYDAHAGYGPYAVRMEDAVPGALAYADHVRGATGEAWRAVARALGAALAAVARPEKLRRLATWVKDGPAESGIRVILARNRAAASATTAALDESTITPQRWRDRVRVLTITELAAGRDDLTGAEAMVLTGPPPRSRAGLLALPPARELRVITTGAFETYRAARQAGQARAALTALRKEAHTVSAARLGLPPPVSAISAGTAEVRVAHNTAPMAEMANARDGSPWEPFSLDILAILRDKAASTPTTDATFTTPVRGSGNRMRTLVDTMAIQLENSGAELILLAAPNDPLTRRRGTELHQVAAKSLAVGDHVVLADLAARRDLMQTVAARLSESPTYAPLVALVEFWHQRAHRAGDSGMTHREILDRMHGTSITSEQAIGSWIRGDVQGPLDPADIGRFAHAVRDRELLAEAERVGWALKTLQSVRRKVAHWIAAASDHAPRHTSEAWVDAHLRIRVADLLDGVTIHRVARVDLGPWRAPAHALGLALPLREGTRLLVPA